jgi:hypothetical protein
MTMGTNPTSGPGGRFSDWPQAWEYVREATAAERVRALVCPWCQAGAMERCGIITTGDHFARWAAARRQGLITAAQAGEALDLLSVVTDGAIVPDGAA